MSMLSEKQIEDVQDSFALVVPIADVAATIFYDRLFEIRPDFRRMFPADMEIQRGKLMTTLATVVQSLHEIDKIVPAVQDLGRRHVDYGVSDDDYAPVGEALLYTLERGLDKHWTKDVAEAWTMAYTVLSDVMISAAAEARAA